MKRLGAVFTVFLLTSPLLFGDVIAPVVMLNRDAPSFVIPVTARVTGVQGADFRTDVTIINYRQQDQVVALRWMPEGASGASEPPTLVTVPAFSAVSYENFVEVALGRTGVGAVLVTGLRSDGSADPDAQLGAFARIWSRATCEGIGGTLSQSVNAVSVAELVPGAPAFIHGNRQDGMFRTNVGIVNLDPVNTQTFSVITRNPAIKETFTISVPPLSMEQFPVPVNVVGFLSIYIEPVTKSGPWTAYASSIDNASGSAWTVPAAQLRTASQTNP